MRYSILLYISFIYSSHFLVGQDSIAIGSWFDYIPYQSSNSVALSKDKVFLSVKTGLAILDKFDGSIDRFSKTDGLTESDISLIRYNSAIEKLVVVYSSSNIDLVGKGMKVTNFPYIDEAKGIVGGKAINDIFFSGKFGYLATQFGMVKVDLEQELVVYTTFTGTSVADVAVWDKKVMLSTKNGVYAFDETRPGNPLDFNQWNILQTSDGKEFSGNFSQMTVSNDALYVVQTVGNNSSLWKVKQNISSNIYNVPAGFTVNFMKPGSNLYLGLYNNDESQNGRIVGINPLDEVILDFSGQDCVNRPLDLEEDTNLKNLWISDKFDGFRVLRGSNFTCSTVPVPNSPYSQDAASMYFQNRQLLVIPSNSWFREDYNDGRNGYYLMSKDGQWTRTRKDDLPGLPDDASLDWTVAAPDFKNNKIWVGSFRGGVVEVTEGKTWKVYDRSNSSLLGTIGDATRPRVSGIALDPKNNLWVANYNSPKPISVRKSDGTWRNFELPASGGGKLKSLLIDKQNYKWFLVGGGSGVLVFDDGGDIDNTGNDRFKYFSSSNSPEGFARLKTSTANALAQDKDGDIWVATDGGIVQFACGSGVFNQNCTGSVIIKSQTNISGDNFNNYVLGDIRCLSIYVDGANRKWVGTDNGLYLLSSDGRTEIAHFTVKNSPLIDNQVVSLAGDPENGRVFIGTARGITSIRSEATDGSILQGADIYAFPNPVRPGYEGPIVIKGLAQDSNVKITDVNGQLVFETKALGGQAIWNGLALNGTRVGQGVYLVFCTSTSLETPDTAVTKILMMK
jgi:hypothetical protein